MTTKKIIDFLLCSMNLHKWKKDCPRVVNEIFGLIIETEIYRYRYCERCFKRQVWVEIYGNLNKIGEWQNYNGESKMEENWNPIAFDVNGLIITWQEKYGLEKTETCIGLWENIQYYLLSWKDERKVYIEKSNINSIRFTKVKKN